MNPSEVTQLTAIPCFPWSVLSRQALSPDPYYLQHQVWLTGLSVTGLLV